ncbi:imidazole glycerol phosphate synthase subunit HisF [Camelliibacillus cellulosilyticus]|uniref:Imidazole glycerol phosphate synthase subunit HisF n=1 Tax=Camelliibacillus cellulosilyticus TaxID=2174486 RepID=A0ABV9GLS7_9BACL
MLAKRLIPCLDVKDGRVVKGTQFLDLKDAGDPVELAAFYDMAGADELVFLDISASLEGRKTLLAIVRRVAERLSIPFTVGGGIQSAGDMKNVLHAGADKIAINTSAIDRPELITEGADIFGSQCITVAIDAKYDAALRTWRVFTHGGRRQADWTVVEWAREAVRRGAGEILLTSMDRDGEKTGFDLELTRAVSEAVSVPVIASGGAGSAQHFYDVLSRGKADAALAASVFHYKETSIPEIKDILRAKGLTIR